MGTQLGTTFIHPQLRGQIHFNRGANIRVGLERYGVSGILGAAAMSRVVSASGNLDLSGSPGALVLCAAGSSYTLTIGHPGEPGRRFRFVLTGTLDSGGETVRIQVDSASSAANRVMSGTVMVNDSATTRQKVKEFLNHRSVTFNGSGTASNQPYKGDWIEFLDAGTLWHFVGMTRARNSGQITGQT